MNYLASNDMKPKFEIGDRVRYNELEGVIVGVDAESKRYLIQYEDDDDKYCVKEDWIEFANPRTAFLTRLQELLATFDATIYDYEQYKLCIDLGGGEQMEWYWGDKPMDKSRLAADNVFDYDKD